MKWLAHIAPGAVVTYTEGTIASATIILTNRPNGSSEYLSFQDGFEPSAYGLSSSGYASSTGRLVVSGRADPSVYQTMLRSLVYVDGNTNPTESERTLTVRDRVLSHQGPARGDRGSIGTNEGCLHTGSVAL